MQGTGDKGLVLDRYGQCPLVSDDETCNVFVPSPESTGFSRYTDIWYLPNEVNAAAYEELLALTSILKSGAKPEASKPRRTSMLQKAFLSANS